MFFVFNINFCGNCNLVLIEQRAGKIRAYGSALLQQFLPSSWAVVISMVGCAAAGTFFVPWEEKTEEVEAP